MRPLRIGIVTTCMDERVARGTALVARRFVERLPTASAEFSFTLIHARHVADPLYQRYPELVYPNLRLPVGSAMCNEALFWLRHWIQEERFDIAQDRETDAQAGVGISPPRRRTRSRTGCGLVSADDSMMDGSEGSELHTEQIPARQAGDGGQQRQSRRPHRRRHRRSPDADG